MLCLLSHISGIKVLISERMYLPHSRDKYNSNFTLKDTKKFHKKSKYILGNIMNYSFCGFITSSLQI